MTSTARSSQPVSATAEPAHDGSDQLSEETEKEKQEEPTRTRHVLRAQTRKQLLMEVEALYCLGLMTVPLCAPFPDGSCSVPWHPMVCARAGKRPLVAGYPRLAVEQPTLDHLLKGYFARFRRTEINIGIVVPRGHVAIEADTPEADAELAEILGGTRTMTRSARAGRGHAFILRMPDGATVRSATGKGHSRAIDIRAPGGILVAPPSQHASGYIYEWRAREIQLASTALLAFLESVWSRRPSRSLVRSLGGSTADDGELERPGDHLLPSLEERLVRAEGYLRAKDPAIQGHRGSDRCFEAARDLIRGFCLPFEKALELLVDVYNSDCVPPWSRAELVHKLRSAELARLPWGYLFLCDEDNRLLASLEEASQRARWLASSRMTSDVTYAAARIRSVETHVEKWVIRFEYEDALDRTPRPRLWLDRPIGNRARERWEHIARAVSLPDLHEPVGLGGRRVRLELIGPSRRVGRVFPPIENPMRKERAP